MPDTEYKRLIQSAKERAQYGFLALMQRAMQDADKHIVETLGGARSGLDQTALASVRHFLRQDGNTFLRRVDALFRTYLDRAMQTMYVDLRPGMKNLSANELSLIDDEVVTHQIEVGRLAERMREANEEVIGRLNVIVGRLHGQHEARERENPFRPYLLARAMYEAIREIATDESKAKALFDHLSNALVQHLPGYYQSIHDVFEASGVRGRFRVMPSRAAQHQQYFGAAPLDPHVSSRVMPGLQRMVETLQSVAAAGPNPGNLHLSTMEAGGAQPSVQDFIRKMFTPSKSFILAPGSEFARGRVADPADEKPAMPASPLVAQLGQYQKRAASGQALAEQGASDKPAALREHIDLDKASVTERLTVDVVTMLFEFILEDQQIPSQLRQQIGRLQIPMLKAAVIDPELLHDEQHPARQLLNRMSTAAVGVDPASQNGRQLSEELTRIVDKVLAEFDTDVSVFSVRLQEFEHFLSQHLRQEDKLTAQGIDAVEAAEKFSVLLTNVTNTLCDILLPLNADKRISDFIIHVWPHVLVQAAAQDSDARLAADDPASALHQYRSVLPELLWSIQEKNPQERSALIRLLPDLVKRLRKALQLIQLPEEESKEILDQLVEMHTAVLRGNVKPVPGAKPMSLDELRQQFSRLSLNWDRVSWHLSDPPQPRASVIEEVFANRGIAADLNLGIHTTASSPADREFLAQTYLLGTRVAFRSGTGESMPGQLVWISTHKSLYLFKRDGDGQLMLYTVAALLEGLRDESVVPVEYAPVFERAVESLLWGVDNMQTAV